MSTVCVVGLGYIGLPSTVFQGTGLVRLPRQLRQVRLGR